MEEKFQRKLQMLMKNEGISQSRLAEMLEVKPSTLSHILAGRNYPGFDMLQKLRRLFPHINADWLLLDTSEDYLATTPTASATSATSAASNAADLFSGGNAPDNPATSAARGSFGNTSRSSVAATGRVAGTAAGAGDVGDARTAADMRTVGSATGVVGGARTAGSAAGTVGAAGAVGGVDARRMAAAPSLFDPSSMPDGSSAGAGVASSPLSAQTLSSFDRADGLRIRRIIVLYDDNSFESFAPRP